MRNRGAAEVERVSTIVAYDLDEVRIAKVLDTRKRRREGRNVHRRVLEHFFSADQNIESAAAALAIALAQALAVGCGLLLLLRPPDRLPARLRRVLRCHSGHG